MSTSLLALMAPAAQAAPNTIVSLTFDDGNADHVAAAAKINSLGMPGTFFVPSGFLNVPNYMSSAQVQALYTAGNEVGGHTVTHADLTQVGADEAKRQVCNDRANLTALGIPVTSFAYPFASINAQAEQIVQDCGYNSGRGLGDLESHIAGTTGFGFAEDMPPADPFVTRAHDQVDSTWTLANLQDLVTKSVNNGGGWVQYTFHHVGNTTPTAVSDPLTISDALFNEFADWLAAEKTAGRVDVQTVNQVIGGPAKALVAGPDAPAAQTTGNLIKNPSLETPGSNGSTVPKCWQTGGFGTNTPTFTRVAGHMGTLTASQQVQLAGYADGDAKLLPYMDLGECAPSAIGGHSYKVSVWYKSDANSQFVVYYRSGTGAWQNLTWSPWIAPSANWAQATWDTGALPADATAISVGLALFSNGTLTTDDYELYDIAGVKSFSDVATSNQFYKEISWLSNNQITTGYPDGTFRPLAQINRDAMAAFLYRLSGSPAVPANAPTFSDVGPGNPFYNEIRWLASTGITTGYPDGTFRPLAPVNRDAMAAFLYRLSGKPAISATAPTFPDVAANNQFYNEIRWLASTGITTGYPDGTFKPVQEINRDAMGAFMYRYNLNFPKGM
ncbi:S-layer homology domain-containing protein [Pseudarthrobacter equi]|uniref:S-layer homology domain-containing protein n=1 Tax=Pseudarthrobacter equi TaxID=728066 RepID=UPI0021BF98E1|nr:S-layer homology domain-containing protein [Pseudarthrobacter equi]MCT9624945.1 S-layer homology domain-containing protein [Pseudarthrobacter equi]